jgi:hypothetical protein
LPERVLGRPVTKCTRFGRAIAPRLPSTCFLDLRFQRRAQFGVAIRAGSLTTAKATGSWPFNWSVDADHGHFGDGTVALHGLLDLARAEAVAGDVDDVVGAAEDVVVALLVLDAPVEGGIDLRLLEQAEIGADEALVVTPDGRQAAGGSGGTMPTMPFSLASQTVPSSRKMRKS